jgi:sugar phosphate isomerase/epimerase
LEDLLRIECEELYELGEYAKSLGVKISVQNHTPHMNIPAYGSFLDKLSEQIRKIAHTHVGICLDYGHANLSANYYQFDFLS